MIKEDTWIMESVKNDTKVANGQHVWDIVRVQVGKTVGFKKTKWAGVRVQGFKPLQRVRRAFESTQIREQLIREPNE